MCLWMCVCLCTCCMYMCVFAYVHARVCICVMLSLTIISSLTLSFIAIHGDMHWKPWKRNNFKHTTHTHTAHQLLTQSHQLLRQNGSVASQLTPVYHQLGYAVTHNTRLCTHQASRDLTWHYMISLTIWLIAFFRFYRYQNMLQFKIVRVSYDWINLREDIKMLYDCSEFHRSIAPSVMAYCLRSILDQPYHSVCYHENHY